MKCPICNTELQYRPSIMHIMDGNTIYECTKDKIHVFWIHPFSFDEIHWNPKAEEDDWKSFLWWKIKNEKYELQLPDVSKIVRNITNMLEYQELLVNRIRKNEEKEM